jgi:CRISPR-associated protein Cst2
MSTQIASLSISARAILDMHSLNNEGGEGNQIQTRMVDIYGADERMHNVNAISGDMLKHIQAQHFFELARAQGLPLCAGCARFDANRINADSAWVGAMPAKDPEALDALLRHCALDDVAGILMTAGGRSLPRKSVVEFGWVVGVPTLVESNSYFHVKYAQRDQERRAADASAREKEGSNLGQAIFHRPASSGVYAIICHLELGRIGYNDITQTYALSEEERRRRTTALLQSVTHTFLELNGAMRATQTPHLVDLKGVVTWSPSGATPAPLLSPLMEDYQAETARVAHALGGGAASATFDSLGAFAETLRARVDDTIPANLVPVR